MSTITDAVNKRKHEEELEKSKNIDLSKPPEVDIPYDWQRIRRRIFLSLIILVVVIVFAVVFSFRTQIGDYVASIMPSSAKGRVDDSGEKGVSTPGAAKDIETSSKDMEAGIPPEGGTTHQGRVEENAYFPELSIGGIYHDPLDPEALINGRWLKTGETVDGVVVKEIMKDGVRVKYNNTEKVILFR